MQKAVDRLGLDLDASELDDQLTTAAVHDTEIIILKVEDPDQARASATLDAVATPF